MTTQENTTTNQEYSAATMNPDILASLRKVKDLAFDIALSTDPDRVAEKDLYITGVAQDPDETAHTLELDFGSDEQFSAQATEPTEGGDFNIVAVVRGIGSIEELDKLIARFRAGDGAKRRILSGSVNEAYKQLVSKSMEKAIGAIATPSLLENLAKRLAQEDKTRETIIASVNPDAVAVNSNPRQY